MPITSLDIADLALLATKADVERLEAEFRRLDATLKAEVQRLEAKLDNQIELLRRDLTIRLGSMIVVGVGILLAAKFFG